MRRALTGDWSDRCLAVLSLLALSLALYFRLRYGDLYRTGDTEHRRAALSDQLAYLVPGVVAACCLGALALRRLCGGSIKAQWERERELLRSARNEG